jgi:hypothetical protein
MSAEERLDLFRVQRLQMRRIAEAVKVSDEVRKARRTLYFVHIILLYQGGRCFQGKIDRSSETSKKTS